MMMSTHGNAFHVTLLSAKSTGHWIPVKRDRIAQFSCFRWCWPQWAVEQTVEFLQITSNKICQSICILVTLPVFSGFNQCYYPFPQNRFTGTGAIIYLLKMNQHWIKWWIGVVSHPMLNLSILRREVSMTLYFTCVSYSTQGCGQWQWFWMSIWI